MQQNKKYKNKLKKRNKDYQVKIIWTNKKFVRIELHHKQGGIAASKIPNVAVFNQINLMIVL